MKKYNIAFQVMVEAEDYEHALQIQDDLSDLMDWEHNVLCVIREGITERG